MRKYNFKVIKPKSFKGKRLKKIAYAFRGYFPHNYIESDRIIIRHPRRRDWKSWVNLRKESYKFLCKWEPYWDIEHCNRSNYMKQLRLQRSKAVYDQAYSFLCFKNDNKELIGGINISNIQRSVMQTCNIGYWLGESHIKKGYMEESMRSIIPYIFKNLKIHRIQAFTLDNNTSSRNLLEKLNFKNEGVLRKAMKINNVWEDHLLFALLNSDNH